jgi:TPR repeat protein
MFRDGIGVSADPEQSIKMFKEAAEAGHQQAQATLAELLLGGKARKSEAEAFKWYLRSAEAGNPKSQYQVAVMYRDGVGTNTDVEMSRKWFNVFLRSSFANHQIMMAETLKNQKSNAKFDYRDLLTKAAESQNSNAMFLLGVACRDQIPPDIDQSVKWLNLSADRNNVQAQMELGDMYLKGIGVRKDQQRAFHYYLRASSNGNSLASYRISVMYKTGMGVEKNIEKYREFLPWSQRSEM